MASTAFSEETAAFQFRGFERDLVEWRVENDSARTLWVHCGNGRSSLSSAEANNGRNLADHSGCWLGN
jgi:hypothetical protein